MAQLNLDDLFMEAYHLYRNGFRYSYTVEDKDKLRVLFDDYIQKSDVDMVLDIQVNRPETGTDVYQISLLDLVTTLLSLYPYYIKRLNVVTVGKLLNDRGFRSVRKGKNRTTYYEISKSSNIIKLISGEGEDKVYLG